MSKYLHTILVVDDEEIIRDSFEDIFTRKGYNVIKAGDGVEALKIIKSTIIDLTIADVKMPKMNGLELLKHIKALYKDLPVILMTGYGSEDIAMQALTLGASNYLKKPFNLLHVIDTIEKVLFFKVSRDRIKKKDILVKKTLENLKLFELSFPIDIDTIEGGVLFVSEYLFGGSVFKTNIEIGVHEALLNAYYHGSLNVNEALSSKKDDVDFYDIVAERLKDKSLSDKNIHLKITSNADEHVFTITDDGDGFDWQKVLEQGESELEMRPFGRGIMLIKSFFDEVYWNEKGNEITITLKKDSAKSM
jgi:CheY-like chemotaxis protein/anti-sigma regulatory factor (Ser/Thr protein kinase)